MDWFCLTRDGLQSGSVQNTGENTWISYNDVHFLDCRKIVSQEGSVPWSWLDLR